MTGGPDGLAQFETEPELMPCHCHINAHMCFLSSAAATNRGSLPSEGFTRRNVEINQKVKIKNLQEAKQSQNQLNELISLQDLSV